MRDVDRLICGKKNKTTIIINTFARLRLSSFLGLLLDAVWNIPETNFQGNLLVFLYRRCTPVPQASIAALSAMAVFF